MPPFKSKRRGKNKTKGVKKPPPGVSKWPKQSLGGALSPACLFSWG